MSALPKHVPPPQHSFEEIVEFLRGVSLFEEIKGDGKAMEAIARITVSRSYRPGDTMIKEGEMGTEMFLLIDGDAGIFKNTLEGDRYKVAILRSLDRPFFGEGGLLGSDARSATIVADTDCNCLTLSRESFAKFSREQSQWALPILLKIAKVVMGRLQKTNNDLMLLYNALVAEIRGS